MNRLSETAKVRLHLNKYRYGRLYQKYRDNPVCIMQWAFKHQKMSDSQLYKQAGNGVTVTVIQRIGEKLNI